jgi:hypothetical protein
LAHSWWSHGVRDASAPQTRKKNGGASSWSARIAVAVRRPGDRLSAPRPLQCACLADFSQLEALLSRIERCVLPPISC